MNFRLSQQGIPVLSAPGFSVQGRCQVGTQSVLRRSQTFLSPLFKVFERVLMSSGRVRVGGCAHTFMFLVHAKIALEMVKRVGGGVACAFKPVFTSEVSFRVCRAWGLAVV